MDFLSSPRALDKHLDHHFIVNDLFAAWAQIPAKCDEDVKKILYTVLKVYTSLQFKIFLPFCLNYAKIEKIKFQLEKDV